MSYRLACWHHGFIGRAGDHPFRTLQALIRFRAADAWAIERWLILCDIRAELAAEYEAVGAP
jgi:hypothetical protein